MSIPTSYQPATFRGIIGPEHNGNIGIAFDTATQVCRFNLPFSDAQTLALQLADYCKNYTTPYPKVISYFFKSISYKYKRKTTMSQPQFEPHQNILNAYNRLSLEIRAVKHTGEPIQEIPVKKSIRPLRQRLLRKLCLMGKPDDWGVLRAPVYNRLKLYKLHNTRARRALGWLLMADYLLFFPINRLRHYLSGGL